MGIRQHMNGYKNGFTIVELIVVVAVISILATISILGYGAWRSNTISTQVKNDLNATASAMENYRTFNNGYPTTLPSSVQPSGNVTLTLSTDSTMTKYCVDAVSSDNPTSTYYVASETKDQGALSGTCATRPGQTLPGVPTGLATTSVASTSVGLTWSAGGGGSPTSYTAQCASDTAFVLNFGNSIVSSTTATVSGLAASTTHYCHVKATNGAGSSAWSTTISTNTNAYQPPTGFAATTITNTSITLGWTANSDAVTYTVQCASDSGFTTGVLDISVSAPTTTAQFNSLTPNTTYYCRANSVNPNGTSAWTATITPATTANFGTIAAATGLNEVSPGPINSNMTWNGITCSLGTPYYRFVWVNPYAGSATAWSTSTGANVGYPQQNANTWKVQTKCTYTTLDSSITDSAQRSFTSVGTADPVGAFGAIGWNDRWQFNVNASTYTCTSPAVLQYQLVATLIDYTSGTWAYGWTTSTYSSVTNANQGARMTTYFQVRCLLNGISSNVISSGTRTDNASVDAPGYVPGWCAGSCGSPRGDRWSAVGCPAGTYAVYWAYLVGDYSNPVWGAYEAANFYGYDRGYYNYGNTMLNDYLMARCTSDFRSSGYGPQGYARY